MFDEFTRHLISQIFEHSWLCSGEVIGVSQTWTIYL